jgi:hypothetical protein
LLGSCGGIFQLTHLMQTESGGASGPGGAGAGAPANATAGISASPNPRTMGIIGRGRLSDSRLGTFLSLRMISPEMEKDPRISRESNPCLDGDNC